MSSAIQSRQPADFTYIVAGPSKWTFQPDNVRRFVEDRLEGRVLNLFAGKTKLRHDGEIIRNDINPEVDADFHFDAINVRNHFEPGSFDTVILDPPYNVRKAREKYDGRSVQGKFTFVKEQVAPIVRAGGKTIQFGYSSVGFGPSRGFKMDELALIRHGGSINDTIVVVEKRVQQKFSDGFTKVADAGGHDA